MTVNSIPDQALDQALDDGGRGWLRAALHRIGERDEAIFEVFPAAGRACGRGPLAGAPGWSIEVAVRVRLLLAVPGNEPAALGRLLFDIYRYGDAGERLAVLRALSYLDERRQLGEHGLPVVRDALRTNDLRLIEAAAGPYGGQWLPDDEFRQAALKCVFVGIPLSAVARLAERTDRELARMFADYARERRVAGRDVPPAVWPVIAGHPEVMTEPAHERGGDL